MVKPIERRSATEQEKAHAFAGVREIAMQPSPPSGEMHRGNFLAEKVKRFRDSLPYAQKSKLRFGVDPSGNIVIQYSPKGFMRAGRDDLLTRGLTYFTHLDSPAFRIATSSPIESDAVKDQGGFRDRKEAAAVPIERDLIQLGLIPLKEWNGQDVHVYQYTHDGYAHIGKASVLLKGEKQDKPVVQMDEHMARKVQPGGIFYAIGDTNLKREGDLVKGFGLDNAAGLYHMMQLLQHAVANRIPVQLVADRSEEGAPKAEAFSRGARGLMMHGYTTGTRDHTASFFRSVFGLNKIHLEATPHVVLDGLDPKETSAGQPIVEFGGGAYFDVAVSGGAVPTPPDFEELILKELAAHGHGAVVYDASSRGSDIRRKYLHAPNEVGGKRGRKQ